MDTTGLDSRVGGVDPQHHTRGDQAIKGYSTIRDLSESEYPIKD